MPPAAWAIPRMAALYGGLLLRCGNDGKLYCLNPDTGTELWSVTLGQRLYGCPVAIGEDIFITDDANRLVQLDLACGAVMKETAISGTVYGSLASDGQNLFFITDDGFLHCYRAADLQQLWKTAVALFTDSTPQWIKEPFIWPISKAGQWRSTWRRVRHAGPWI